MVHDSEKCIITMIREDVPFHPLAFAVQFVIIAIARTSRIAADAAPQLIIVILHTKS